MAESASSKRRLQSNAACKGCRKRKSRCDGARPRCSNCEIRDVQCEYASPSSTSKRPRPSRVAVVSTPSSTAREHNVDDGEQTYLGPSTTFNFVSDCSKRGPNGAQPAFQSHLSPLPGSDASARSTTTLQTIGAALDLPDRDLADRLVDAYFSHTHQLYPVLHEGTFRAEYESMWERSSSYQHHSGLSWHALLNVVFAHGLEPGGLLDDDDASAHTARFIQRSQDLIARHAFKTATLELVQSMLLLCFHLQNTAEIEQCWNLSGLTIRTATSLGVHLSLHQENFLPIERELRKRAWWGCYVLDQSISMQLGRTPCLGVNYGHVGLPLEIDDIYMTNDEIAPTQPSVIPSMVSFFIAVIRLSSIVSEMLEKLYLRDHTKYRDRTENALDPPYSRCHYILSTVIFLEGKLQSWWTQIPAHLKQYATGNERGRSSLQVQRVILRVKYLHVRLLLHRQTLLYFARNEIQDDFCRSIAIASTMKCVDCAHETISLIHSASAEQDIFSLSHSAQHIFTSICVLHVIERLAAPKEYLLRESQSFRSRREDYEIGIELLAIASNHNSLAARYIHILQKLSGIHAQNGPSSSRTDTPAAHGHARMNESGDLQAVANEQEIMPIQPSNWLDSANEFNFNELDNLLFGAGFLDPYSTVEPGSWDLALDVRPS